MTKIIEKKFSTRSEVNNELLADCMPILSKAIKNKAKASMVLSAGTSPGGFYTLLSKEKLDWSKIHFTPSDERCVAPNHKDSNEFLIRNTLLQNNASNSNFISMTLKIEKPIEVFDIVLLGMGGDGHTASLFPDSPDIENALDMNNDNICVSIARDKNELQRISMTLKTLLNTKHIKLLFFGDEKWAIYEQAKKKQDIKYPVSYILNQTDVPVTVYWAK